MTNGQLFDTTREAMEHADVRAFRPHLPEIPSAVKVLYVDHESSGLRWDKGDRSVGRAVKPKGLPAFYLPTGHASENLDPEKVREWERREYAGRRIVNINTKFDAHMSREDGVDWSICSSLGDVGHQEALIDDHERRFGLQHLSEKYGLSGKLKAVHGIPLDKSRMREYPAGVVAPYACADVELVEAIDDAQQERLDALSLRRVQALEDELILPVAEMEMNGFPIDRPLLEQWTKEVEQARLRALWRLERDSGVMLNPDAGESWAKLFQAIGLDLADVPRTDRGALSFEDEYLDTIEHDGVRLGRAAKKLGSLNQKFFVPWLESLGADNILRFHFRQLMSDDGGTVSGRFSASTFEKKGNQVQQAAQPNKQFKSMGFVQDLLGLSTFFPVRRLFKPGAGQWGGGDSRQIEYRLFAHYSGSPRLLRAYAENPWTDFHNIVMAMLQVFRPDIIREHVKNVNFMKVFGGGQAKLAQMLRLAESEAKRLNEQYAQAFPEVRPLQDRMMHLAMPKHATGKWACGATCRRLRAQGFQHQGFVETLLGRRCTFPNGWRIHKALNAVIQGTGADWHKRVLIEVHKHRKDLEYVPRLTNHDEIGGDVLNPDKFGRLQDLLNTQWYPEIKVPILWSCGLGPNWMEAKS